jgi:hypothetical protein
MEPGVKEVLTLEPRHQTGKDGMGKGSARRRGANDKLFQANYDAVFGKKSKNVADNTAGSGSVPSDGRRNRCFDA